MFLSLCRDHHQWYRQMPEMKFFVCGNQEVGTNDVTRIWFALWNIEVVQAGIAWYFFSHEQHQRQRGTKKTLIVRKYVYT